MAEINLRVEGMHCGACIRRVTTALQSVEGVEVEEVRLGGARVSGSAVPAPLIAALGKAGFAAHVEG